MPRLTSITHVQGWDKGLERLVARTLTVSTECVTRAAHEVERIYKATYRGRPSGSQRRSASGKLYYVGLAYPPHPTQRSGADRNSVRVHVEQLGAGVVRSEVGPTMIYSRALNLGNDNAFGKGIHTRAFPQLKMSTEAALPFVRTLYKTAWARALRA